MTRAEMIETVRRIWSERMSDRERVSLKQQLGQALGLGHAFVVGVLDFEDHEDAEAAVDRLEQVARDQAGGCNLG